MDFRDLRTGTVAFLVLTAVGLNLACRRSPAEPESKARTDGDRGSHQPVEGLTFSRSNDHGIVIGGPGKVRDAEYPISNTSNRPIRILEVSNAKPCCGVIAMIPPAPTILQPGTGATLKVRLKLDQTIGPLSHRTLIVTDDTGREPIEIWNYADVRPEIAIVPGAQGRLIFAPGKAHRYPFVVHSNGTIQAPPLPLDACLLRSTLTARWLGEPVKQTHPDGLIQFSRKGEVDLPADGSIGSHVEELRLEFEGRPKAVHPIPWEVTASIRSSPEALIFSGPDQKKSIAVILRSVDGREFQILAVEDEHDHVATTVSRQVRGTVHRLDVTRKPTRPPGGPYALRIRTDHPDQPAVEVPYILLEKAP